MTTMKLLSKIVVLLVEGYCSVAVLKAFCGSREVSRRGRVISQKEQTIAFFVFWIILGSLYQSKWCSLPYFPSGNLIALVIQLGFCYFYLEGNGWRYTFAIGMMYLLVAFNDMAVAAIAYQTGQFTVDELRYGPINQFFTIVTKIVLLIWFVPFYNWRCKRRRKIDAGGASELAMMVIVILFVFYFILGLREAENGYFFITFDSVALILVFFVLLSQQLIQYMQEAAERKTKNELEYEKGKIELEWYEKNRETYQSVREIRHDMKNCIAAMEYMVEKEEYDRLTNYLTEMEQEIE